MLNFGGNIEDGDPAAKYFLICGISENVWTNLATCEKSVSNSLTLAATNFEAKNKPKSPMLRLSPSKNFFPSKVLLNTTNLGLIFEAYNSSHFFYGSGSLIAFPIS